MNNSPASEPVDKTNECEYITNNAAIKRINETFDDFPLT